MTHFGNNPFSVTNVSRISMSYFSLWATAVAVGLCVAAGFSLPVVVFWCEDAKGGGVSFALENRFSRRGPAKQVFLGVCFGRVLFAVACTLRATSASAS